jgi:integrase
MASWRQKPNGKYQVRWRQPDGREGSRETGDRRTCDKLLREATRCEELGIRYEPGRVQAEPEIGEVAKSWLIALESECEDSTIDQHGHRLDLFLRWLRATHKRGPLRLSLLTADTLRAFHAELDGFEDGPRALVTRNKYVRTVHALWRYAWEHDEYGQYAARVKTMKWRAPEKVEARALPWSEIDRVVEAAHGRHRKLLVLLRFTGIRVSEAMALTWEHVDLERGLMRVASKKTKTSRTIPMSPHLVEELAGWGLREGYVVPVKGGTYNGVPAANPREGRARDVHRFFVRAGIAKEYWRGSPHHAFRHALVTNLKAAGVDDEAVEWYVGHDRGIRGVYNDPWALPLMRLVEALPAIGAATAPRTLVDQPWTTEGAKAAATRIKAVR